MAAAMTGPSGALEVELTVTSPRTTPTSHVPVTCGVPWPRGALRDVGSLRLRDAQGRPVPLQARTLNFWPDGAVRWVLLDWQATAASAPYRLSVGAGQPTHGAAAVRTTVQGGSVTVDTGIARFELGTGDVFPFRAALVGGVPAIDPTRTAFVVEDEAGRVYRPRIDKIEVEEGGPVRVQVRMRGELAETGAEPLAQFDARLNFFAGSALVHFDLTIRNPRRAEHPGGLWDLGDPGSVFLRDAALNVTLSSDPGPTECRCSPELAAPFESLPTPLELYQDSSGGVNWKSSNHLNRSRIVPTTFRGYRLRAGAAERSGLRATPAVYLRRGSQAVGITVPWFWQNFPKALEATGDALVLRLFPRQYADAHELQGGEQKTHSFSVLFGATGSPEDELMNAREPAHAAATPDWYCATGAVPYLTPRRRPEWRLSPLARRRHRRTRHVRRQARGD